MRQTNKDVVRKLKNARYENSLKQGTTKFKLDNKVGQYEGELNQIGQAHGFGILVTDDGDVYKGTFEENMPSGYLQVEYHFGLVAIGEMHKGEWYGRRTVYFDCGSINNQVFFPGNQFEAE